MRHVPIVILMAAAAVVLVCQTSATISEEDPACSNGVLDSGEQCDDGNAFNGDGCSSACQLENTNTWICTSNPESNPTTSCCVALTNPLNQEKVCSCYGVSAPEGSGYHINTMCQKINIDECMQGIGNCHRNAVCIDSDASNSNEKFECVCPPGLLGDGINECKVYAYETVFSFIKTNQDLETFDKDAFKQALLDSGVIPAGIPLYRILVTVTLAPQQGRRQAEPTGSVLIEVTVYSESTTEQQSVTAGIQTSAINDPSLAVSSSPSSIAPDAYDALGAPIETVASGFRVNSFQYNESDSTWVVDIEYTHGAPNVVSSLYLTKSTANSLQNTFYASQHPCVVSQSACCMISYRDRYNIGNFAANITQSVGSTTCNANVATTETLSLGFDPSGSQYAIDHTLDNFPDSWIERISAGHIKLHITQVDLSKTGGIAKKEPLPNGQNGFLLTFFVGMTHFTLLPASMLSVVASQVKIQFSTSNSLTFSFSSTQDTTILRYITIQIIQNKWMDGIIERRMQMVKVDFVIPTGLRQNMDTGLVPLTSIRFAISQTMPSQLDQSQWINPCFSASGEGGMYDSIRPYYSMYSQAKNQTCAVQSNLCTNPSSEVLAGNVATFYFPIGDNVINSTNMGVSPAPYYIYAYFQLSVLGSSGNVILSNLFAKAALDLTSTNYACESISTELNLLATTKIDLAVGFIGQDSDWNTTMRVYQDVTGTNKQKAVVDASDPSLKSQTVQSNLISLLITGSPGIFSRESASQYYLNVEQISVMHFLDQVKFGTVMGMVNNGSAYSVVLDSVTGKPRITFSNQVTMACGNDKLSCALESNIFGGTVLQTGNVHSLASGIGTTSTSQTRDWLLQNVLTASDEYSTDLATNMTRIVRSRYSVDDRTKKAWFISSGHKWRRASTSAQSQLLLSDSLIVFASVTLNDGSGNVLRRRMLSMASSSQNMMRGRRNLLMPEVNDEERLKTALQQLAAKPATESMPPLKFGIDVPYSIAKIYGEEQQKYLLISIDAIGRFDSMTTEQVNSEIMGRILANKDKVCSQCRAVYPAFENMLPSSTAGAKRRLLQTSSEGYFAGSVTILLVYDSTMENAIILSYPDILMSIYDEKFTPSLLPSTASDSTLQKLASDLKNLNVFVETVKLAYPQSQVNVVVSRQDSLVYPNGTMPTPVPNSNMLEINMGVYNSEYVKWTWKGDTQMFMICRTDRDCEQVPDTWKKSSSSSIFKRGHFDNWAVTVFLAASLVIFWL